MSIVAASHLENVLDCALSYLEMGISVIPCHGKQPALVNGKPLSWEKFQTQLATSSYIQNWYRAGLLKNIGLIGGAVSDNLVFVDLDGLEAVARFELTFPHLLDTFTVVSGSGLGKHLYFYCDNLPNTTRTKGFELRSSRTYVIAPPSIHPTSGKEYVPNRTEIKRVDNLNEVVRWIIGMIREKHRSEVETKQPSMRLGNTTAYGQSALGFAVRNVCAAAARTRNDALYIESLKLGSLVSDGCLTVHDVESALMRAAAAVGLVDDDGERQCLNTIRSGLRTGMNSSRKDWKKNTR